MGHLVYGVDIEAHVRESAAKGPVNTVQLANQLGIDVFKHSGGNFVERTATYIGLGPLADRLRGKGELSSLSLDNQTGRPAIEVVESRHPLSRIRFAIACHIVQCLAYPDRLRAGERFTFATGPKAVQNTDLRVDSEAAEIIMPDYLVEEFLAARSWSSKSRLGPSQLAETTQYFRTSPAFAAIRLIDLGVSIDALAYA